MEVNLTEMLGCKAKTPYISAMIVGAEKAGTSALIAYLDTVSNISIPMQSGSRFDVEFASEFPYFLSDNVNTALDVSTVLKQSLPNDFDSEGNLVVAKNVGMCTDRDAMIRLQEHSPEVKVIFLLREPISRAISAHRYQLFRGAESEADFSLAAKQCLDNLRQSDRHIDYLHRGLYSQQASNLIEVFGRENCLFLCFDDLVSGSKIALSQLRKFIGLADTEPKIVEKVNAAKEPRSRTLAMFVYRDSGFKSFLRQILPLRFRVRLASWLRRLNSRKSAPVSQEIPLELHEQLRDYFHADLKKTERVTGLSLLDRWGY